MRYRAKKRKEKKNLEVCACVCLRHKFYVHVVFDVYLSGVRRACLERKGRFRLRGGLCLAGIVCDVTGCSNMLFQLANLEIQGAAVLHLLMVAEGLPILLGCHFYPIQISTKYGVFPRSSVWKFLDCSVTRSNSIRGANLPP